MLVTRIYSGDDGHSHFEELDMPLVISDAGAMSTKIPIETLFFRDTTDAGPEVWDFHVAPRRQFALHLFVAVEIPSDHQAHHERRQDTGKDRQG